MSATIVRSAVPGDLLAVEALRRADAKDLGFVPRAKYEHIVSKTMDRGRSRWLYESLSMSEDNDDPTGFVLAGFHRDGAKIEQVCVRQDARRMERALQLVRTVEDEARRRFCPRVRCRVAADIEANLFWRAAGYTPLALTVSTWLNNGPSQSRRPIVVYEKALDQLALDLQLVL